MIHFSIPDTQELNTDNGSTYIGYNIHINGAYHCTVRYKQLYNLHEQLRRKCGQNLPQFPPKKFLPLTTNQIMERRGQLEKYLQAIGQESNISTINILNSFLRTAQQESLGSTTEETTLDIYLMNNYQIQLTLLSTDQTNYVLNKVCQQMNLPHEYIDYFALFIVKRNDQIGDLTIIRKLEDFESPYISNKLYTTNNPNSDTTYRIYLRKMCWDTEYDSELMCHPVSLNLLYVQTVSDVERGWIICTKSVLAQLADLQSRGAKQQYLELARTLKYYGYMQFGYAISDYPQPDTRVIVAIGKRELSMRLPSATECNTREGCFKVTRMRCWRITTVPKSLNSDSCDCNHEPQLELSFEYLLSKDKLRWINISSPHAIFMSTCLQSIVDELLLKKNGSLAAKSYNCDDSKNSSWSYMKRDGSVSLIDLNSTNNGDIHTDTQNSQRLSQQWSEPFSIKKLQEKFTASGLNRSNDKEFIENDAFEDIGDEDL